MEALNQNPFYQQFYDENFDVKDFTAQSIHQGVTIVEQLARIAEGITNLDRELREQVCVHHDDLLSRVTAVETLEEVLKSMQLRIQALLSAIERLRIKVIEPYQKIHNLTTKLSRLQAACDLLRCILRTSNLCKRLQGQLQGGSKDITKCAHTLSELAYLLEGVDVTDLEIISKDLKMIRQARIDVEQKAKDMLDRGTESQNQAQMATALQVFHYLGTLSDVVWQVVKDTKSHLEENIKTALDPRNLSSSSSITQGGSTPGRAAMPTMGNVSIFKATLWSNMEKLADQIYDHCLRIQNLQKVLYKKRDPVTHRPFAEELTHAEGDGSGLDAVVGSFWTAVSNVLTDEFVRAANESIFIKQAFEEEYPKLLRLHSDLWHRLQQFSYYTGIPCSITDVPQASELDSEVNASTQGDSDTKKMFDPEESLRTALVPFENAYLSRSLSRLFDPINLMFSSGETSRPTEHEVKAALRVVTSELNVASVDARLAVTVAKNVVKTIQLFLTKCEQTLSNDSEASQVIGPATAGQLTNAVIVDILHLYVESIRKIIQDVNPNFPKEAVEVIKTVLPAIRDLMRNAIRPLISAVECAIEAIILTMHDEDFSSPSTDGQELGVGDDIPASGQQCSLYMRELQDFIARVKSDYFSLYQCKDLVDESCQIVACRALELFLRHGALIRPLGEGGKRRLAADCAQMELGLSPLCSQVSDLGKSYRMLRAFRPLLFQTPEHIIRSSSIKGTVPFSTVMHLLFSRAPPEIRSPHQTAGWSIAQYSQWLDAHPSESERLELIKGALESYVNVVRLRREREFAPIYPIMLQVLKEAAQSVDKDSERIK